MKKKILLISLAVFMLVGFLQAGKYIRLFLGIPPSKSSVERLYYANEAELKSICSLLQENQYERAEIELFESAKNIICYYRNNKGGFDKTMLEVDDSKKIDDLEKLKNIGYIRVLKEYNYVYFQVWGSFGASVGLIYSQGEKPDTSKINTKYDLVEEIGQTGWYYCKWEFE